MDSNGSYFVWVPTCEYLRNLGTWSNLVYECSWFGGLLGLLDTGSRHGLVVGKSETWKYEVPERMKKVRAVQEILTINPHQQ